MSTVTLYGEVAWLANPAPAKGTYIKQFRLDTHREVAIAWADGTQGYGLLKKGQAVKVEGSWAPQRAYFNARRITVDSAVIVEADAEVTAKRVEEFAQDGLF